jgi:hypothetical protein
LVLGVADDVGWGDEGVSVAARLVPCLYAAITQALDAEGVLGMMVRALEADAASEIDMTAGWCADWIDAAIPPEMIERDR